MHEWSDLFALIHIIGEELLRLDGPGLLQRAKAEAPGGPVTLTPNIQKEGCAGHCGAAHHDLKPEAELKLDQDCAVACDATDWASSSMFLGEDWSCCGSVELEASLSSCAVGINVTVSGI